MKLLTKTSRYYLIASVAIFMISGLIVSHLLHHIFYRQIDETLNEEKLLVEETINYSDSVPDFSPVFGHMIEVTILNHPHKKNKIIHDTVMYDSRIGSFISYRHLSIENTSIRNQGYIINIFKPLQESESLIAEILFAILAVFVSLMVVFGLVNYFIARRVWIPFYRILHNLSEYNILEEKPLTPIKSDIHEFILLNQALQKMSNKIRQDYFNLKEFNENAAHELQTPLAIIKTKMDLLIQNESLTNEQLHLIGSVYDATSKMAKLNQGLLLISKIGNNQFTEIEEIDLIRLIDRTLSNFGEMIEYRKLKVTSHFETPVVIRLNRILAEILVTNLISNSIKHNYESGHIEIVANSGILRISNSGQSMTVNPSELFERFRKSGSKNNDSIGLGLSIVKKITDLYQFRIEYLYDRELHTIQIFFT